MAAMEAAAGGIGAALNKSCRIYGDDDDTLFRLIGDWQRQSLGQICPAILIQMGDAKAHKWMMPKHR